MTGFFEAFHNVIKKVTVSSSPSNQDIWVLGKRFSGSSDEQESLLTDVYSKFYFTYRFDFSPILGSDLSTDAGWGCMHRSGQMILAQALVYLYIGRGRDESNCFK
jgi:hypothetical protein